jgi:hypothetical protein
MRHQQGVVTHDDDAATDAELRKSTQQNQRRVFTAAKKQVRGAAPCDNSTSRKRLLFDN